jgi:hypothetical protein
MRQPHFVEVTCRIAPSTAVSFWCPVQPFAGASLLGVSAVGCFPDEVVGPALSEQPRAAVGLQGDLSEPQVIRSVGGILTASITCSTAPALVGSFRTQPNRTTRSTCT